mmetsp:Transcript_87715/g.283956  ORF Transcript_87715/g.283956 Transcript_87715/m.283956 type:complete len:121 (-) Transcript_87715:3-365(-)
MLGQIDVLVKSGALRSSSGPCAKVQRLPWRQPAPAKKLQSLVFHKGLMACGGAVDGTVEGSGPWQVCGSGSTQGCGVPQVVSDALTEASAALTYCTFALVPARSRPSTIAPGPSLYVLEN